MKFLVPGMKTKLFLLFSVGHLCLSGTAIGKNLKQRDDLVGPNNRIVRKKVGINPKQLERKRAAAAKARRVAVKKAKGAPAPKARRVAVKKAKGTPAQQARRQEAQWLAAAKAKMGGVERYEFFYARKPNAHEARIYDKMTQDARKHLAAHPQFLRDIIGMYKAGKVFFQSRREILARAARGRYNMIWTRDHKYALHAELSDPKGFSYDKVSIVRRLNNIHNAMVLTYLLAKERGKLGEFFKRSVFIINQCMDANSESVKNYALRQINGYDINPQHTIKDISKMNLLYRTLGEDNIGAPDELRKALKQYVGLEAEDGLFQKDDLDMLVQFALDNEYVF